MAPTFHELTIASVETEGTTAKAVGFRLPDALQQTFRFVPGQYLTLRAMIDGKDVRRSYSICSTPDEDELRVAIRAVEGGVFSTYAQGLKPGDTLDVMPPQGRFTADPKSLAHPLLIAAGSGITPILSIARSVLETNEEAQVTLIYGNRSTPHIMFRETLEDLKDRFVERFNLIHVLSRESQDVEIANGRIDADKIRLLAERGAIDVDLHDGVYLCGPQAMVETCTDALRALGMPQEKIRFELFTPADGGVTSAAKMAAAVKAVAGDVTVEVILDGARRIFAMDGKQSRVLEAAQAAGIELPFSCAGGMCCTCRCRIEQGKAEMDANYSLEAWEVEQGFTLACQARPSSEKLVLDFDAA